MANELYRYTDPDDAQVTLTFDSGIHVVGVPVNYNGRSDCKMLAVPLEASGGAVLTVSRDGYQTFSARAVFAPNPNGPSSLDLDDITLNPNQAAPQPPEPEPPPMPTDPLGIINAVFATGNYNLLTIQGCGEFTEECCRQLAATLGKQWGHVYKTPGQNQWNKHAVDAVMSLAGEHRGIWDIIYSSASSAARPVFNRAGDAKPDLWRPPAPLPCQDTLSKKR